jgi:hypothetical protein
MALRRHERIHLQNVRIAVGARRHHFDERIGIPFLCECDDENCHEFVVLPLGAFDKHSNNDVVLVAAGHTLEHGIHMGAEGDGYELYKPAGRRQAAG